MCVARGVQNGERSRWSHCRCRPWTVWLRASVGARARTFLISQNVAGLCIVQFRIAVSAYRSFLIVIGDHGAASGYAFTHLTPLAALVFPINFHAAKPRGMGTCSCSKRECRATAYRVRFQVWKLVWNVWTFWLRVPIRETVWNIGTNRVTEFHLSALVYRETHCVRSFVGFKDFVLHVCAHGGCKSEKPLEYLKCKEFFKLINYCR